MLKQHKFKVKETIILNLLNDLSCIKPIFEEKLLFELRNYWMFKLHKIYIWRKIIIWAKKLLNV